MKYSILLFSLLLTFTSTFAQSIDAAKRAQETKKKMKAQQTAIDFAATITADDLRKHLTVLASDEYEGRETGKKGQKMAAKYIARHFEALGLEAPVEGSYFQTFDLQESQIGNVYFRKGEDKMVGFEDFIYYSSAETMVQDIPNRTDQQEDNNER